MGVVHTSVALFFKPAASFYSFNEVEFVNHLPRQTNRRDFFARTSDGLLGAALTHLLCDDFFGGSSALAAKTDEPGPAPVFDLKPKKTHHPAQATSVIQLFMNGGPSQMDLFDPKPELGRLDGKPFPGNVEEIGNSNAQDIGVMMGGQYDFARHGESGMWMADILPHTSQMADDICLINSMWTDHPNHDNALYKIHSGRLFMGYPTLGAWTVYGLGSENQDLPAYVVLNDPLWVRPRMALATGRRASCRRCIRGLGFARQGLRF